MSTLTQRWDVNFKASIDEHVVTWQPDGPVDPGEQVMIFKTRFRSPVQTYNIKPDEAATLYVLGKTDTATLLVDSDYPTIDDDFRGWVPGSFKDPRDYFYIKQELQELHLAFGIPTYIQFVVEVTGNGKYRFGDDHNILVEVDAGDVMDKVGMKFEAVTSKKEYEKTIGFSIFGLMKNLPSFKDKFIRISLHYDFGILKDGDTLHMAWHALWVQYKGLISQTLSLANTYDESDLLTSIRSVRLQGRSGNSHTSRDEDRAEE